MACTIDSPCKVTLPPAGPSASELAVEAAPQAAQDTHADDNGYFREGNHVVALAGMAGAGLGGFLGAAACGGGTLLIPGTILTLPLVVKAATVCGAAGASVGATVFAGALRGLVDHANEKPISPSRMLNDGLSTGVGAGFGMATPGLPLGAKFMTQFAASTFYGTSTTVVGQSVAKGVSEGSIDEAMETLTDPAVWGTAAFFNAAGSLGAQLAKRFAGNAKPVMDPVTRSLEYVHPKPQPDTDAFPLDLHMHPNTYASGHIPQGVAGGQSHYNYGTTPPLKMPQADGLPMPGRVDRFVDFVPSSISKDVLPVKPGAIPYGGFVPKADTMGPLQNPLLDHLAHNPVLQGALNDYTNIRRLADNAIDMNPGPAPELLPLGDFPSLASLSHPSDIAKQLVDVAQTVKTAANIHAQSIRDGAAEQVIAANKTLIKEASEYLTLLINKALRVKGHPELGD